MMIKFADCSATDTLVPTFNKQVKDLSGVDYSRCYQCLTCTLSCPVISIMDYSPNQIIRMIQLGARAEVLQSKTIWRCASCETCVSRCPQGVDICRLMDTLRQIALQENQMGEETTIPTFHQIFLKSIRKWGREYELGMVIELKLKGKDFFNDLATGIRMLLKRKLRLIPHDVKGSKDIKTIFQRSEKG